MRNGGLNKLKHAIFPNGEKYIILSSDIIIRVEPQIKDTIEITSEQSTRLINVPNGGFPNIFLTSDKGQPLNKGQNG